MYIIRVLVVDDEAGMRNSILRVLDNFKMKLPDIDDQITFKVHLAETGNEALSLINSERPDLILLDYQLPDMTGLEILDQIDTSDETTLTIMITAYASLETAVSAIKSGAFDFLSKPFTPEEIRTKVAKAAQSIILAKHVKKLNEEKRQVRFQFITVLGHELKSPLGAVEGYLYMLHDKTLGDDFSKYEDCISRCLIRTEQMRKLILDLLEMTKIESGTRQRELKQVDLSEIINISVETMLPDAEKRNIEIINHCTEPIIILADSTELEIVFNNLVSNAVKYNKDNGTVEIEVCLNDNKVIAKVKDSGLGMTKEETEKLFHEFVRIKNNKTKNILGTGLGLSTIKKISQLYHGDIIVESEPDVGSTFIVSLMTDKAEKVENNLLFDKVGE